MIIAKVFPGYTVSELWRTPFSDWVLLADAADTYERTLRERSRSKH